MLILNVIDDWIISKDGYTAITLSKLERLEYDIYDNAIYALGQNAEQIIKLWAFEEGKDSDEEIAEVMEKLVREIVNHRKYGTSC